MPTRDECHGQSALLEPVAGLDCQPIVGRLAGLDGQLLERFGNTRCLPILDELHAIERELAGLRPALVERIEKGLTLYDPASRRFLLQVKRHCFNGREIAPLRRSERWQDLASLAGAAAERIAELELEAARLEQDLEPAFAEGLREERRLVAGLLADRRFVRGVAIGKSDLIRLARQKARALDTAGFRRGLAKWELSLARYATRAAGKLSVNSTLTSYCTGRAVPAPGDSGLRLPAPAAGERSLVRMNRQEIEHFQQLLLRDPRFKSYRRIAWNDSLEEPEPGQYRFLRDACWTFEPGAADFGLTPPARIKVRLHNQTLDAARSCLLAGPLGYEQLVSRLRRDDPRPAAEVDREIEQLLELGILIAQPPWSICEPWLEEAIASCLHALRDPELEPLTRALDRLLELERTFAAAERPEEHLEEMKQAAVRLMEPVGVLPHVVEHLRQKTQFFEDVLQGDGEAGFEVGAAEVERLMESADLVQRFAGLFNYRHDVLHTLAGWWRAQAPERAKMPFLELAKAFAPVFKHYGPAHHSAGENVLSSFDPLQLSSLAELRERRKALIDASRAMLLASPEQDRLTNGDLQALLRGLPSRYAPLVGAGVFVQPLGEGAGWVMNQLCEGTGRYLSRVTPVLGETARRFFVDHLVDRSTLPVDGEEAQLLEIVYPWGNLVSAHEPQSRLVLDMRGLNLELPAERKIRLEELTVEADLEQEKFRLSGRHGRRLLPAHLCSMVDAGLPLLLRLLLMFGPGETRGVFPLALAEGDDERRTYRRVICGDLVVRRKSWSLAIGKLKGALPGLDDFAAYREVNRWWRQQGLPAQAYYWTTTWGGRVKPQFIDAGSGILCSLFAASLLKKKSSHLVVDEALPAPKDFPLDARRQRRCFELLIDSMAVRADPRKISGGS